MIEINGEKWEIIYHWCYNTYNSYTGTGTWIPFMLRKVEVK